MKRILIRQANIVNEGISFTGSVVIEDEQIVEVLCGEEEPLLPCDEVIEAKGYYLLPGVIDDHVHFRDPGLTKKADITTESRAAAAGGVTSVMDMPNTNPQTVTPDAWHSKMELMADKSLVNYSCYFGATNTNYHLFKELDPRRVCGIKLFMGSSTGDMLVDKTESLQNIFNGTDLLIATHCESQQIIKRNTEELKAKYGVGEGDQIDLPLCYHPLIRSEEACYLSSQLAVSLAKESGARLHILHLSTARELDLFDPTLPTREKRITAEACIPHLLFTADDYETYGTRIKCNPAIKNRSDREAIRQAVNSGLIDVIATDHAPHLLIEKQGGALRAMSGMPMVQFSLVSMLELVNEGVFSIEKIVEKMCHAPADIYRIHNRGYIRSGYQADLVLVKPGDEWTLTEDLIYSKCGWSPLEGRTFSWKVDKTFVNGTLVYSGNGMDENYRGQALEFK